MRYLGLLAGIGLLLAVAGGAMATTYNIEHSHSNGNTPGGGSGNWLTYNGTSYANPFVGRFAMEPRPNTTYPAILPANYPIYQVSAVHGIEMGFFSYCLEPDQPIGVGHGTSFQYPFTIGALAGSDGISGTSLGAFAGASEANLIEELFGRYNPLLSADPTGPYSGGTYRTAAMALQLAIWKINLDAGTETLGGWDFGSGLVRVNSALVNYESTGSPSAKFDAVALAMLNSLTGTGPKAYGLEGLRNPTYQDLIIQSIPEPVTMAGLMLGIGSVVTYVRKRRTA